VEPVLGFVVDDGLGSVDDFIGDFAAAVCGQLAGAFYGIDGIPARWLNRLAGRSMIEQMAMALDRGRA